MMKTTTRLFCLLAFAGSLGSSALPAQQGCTGGIRVDGTVIDPTGALVAGAQVRTSDGQDTKTDNRGGFQFLCVRLDALTITVNSSGFAEATVQPEKRTGTSVHLDVRLALAQVETNVEVGRDSTAIDPDNGASTRNLDADSIRQLSDDPDDLIQQLQILAANGGGAPESTTFVVDGFQNTTAMPPKNSIASIRINPDPYSSVYEGPTFQGGRVEITTKAGAEKFHGALFFTDSDGSFNATNPFSVTATPAGRRRYGFELSGPIIPKKSGFSLALEKRDIDEFNVVNATTLDQQQNQVAFHQTVPADQRLWIASARGDLQVSPKDVATLSFSANVNNSTNRGVGGLILQEAGYANLISEYDLRFSNILTLSPNILHETRIGYTWKETAQTPNSTAPSLEVAGYFTGGGATAGNLSDRERDLEIDDQVTIVHGKHTMKFGAQSLGFFVHNYDPDTFNGQFTFGGGSAPGLDSNNQPTSDTIYLNPIDQYKRALQNLPGGTPTSYQATTGTPLVPFSQWRLALFAEDVVKLAPRLSMSAGLRYSFQTSPGTWANFGPRLAFSWSPDKNSKWVIHLRGGMFVAPPPLSYTTDVYRLDGSRQLSELIYSPSFSNPLSPIPGSISVSTINQYPRHVFQFPAAAFQIGIERELPHGWHPAIAFTNAEDWGIFRTRNINAPMVPDSVGTAPDPTVALRAPRPIAPNENIFLYENSGHLNGNLLNLTLSQHSNKHFTLNMSYSLMHFKSDAPLQIAPPQSSYSKRGESSRPDWQANGGSIEATLNLPAKIEFSTQLAARAGRPYNVTTGTDANGDGTFNDRPAYISGAPQGSFSTPFGQLTANAVNGDVPRNLGTMPSTWRLFANISRTFSLNPKDKDHPRTLSLNARAANLLNHTNATGVATVLSPMLGQPLSAEPARRIELGARFAF